MTLEIEAKLWVSDGFQVPFDRLRELGLESEHLPAESTSTKYFDSADLCLMSCGAALRFRETSGKGSAGRGTWTLKFSPPQHSHVAARHEYEAVGTDQEFPATFYRAFRVFGCQPATLSGIAALDAQRRSSTLKRGAADAGLQIDDDMVEVVFGANSGRIFREIEVELTEGGAMSDMHAVVDLLVDSGAELAKVSSKLEQAIVNDLTGSSLEEVVGSKSPHLVADLSSIARFVLDADVMTKVDLANSLRKLLVDLTDEGLVGFVEVISALSSSDMLKEDDGSSLAEFFSVCLSSYLRNEPASEPETDASLALREKFERDPVLKSGTFFDQLANLTAEVLFTNVLGGSLIDVPRQLSLLLCSK